MANPPTNVPMNGPSNIAKSEYFASAFRVLRRGTPSKQYPRPTVMMMTSTASARIYRAAVEGERPACRVIKNESCKARWDKHGPGPAWYQQQHRHQECASRPKRRSFLWGNGEYGAQPRREVGYDCYRECQDCSGNGINPRRRSPHCSFVLDAESHRSLQKTMTYPSRNPRNL